MCWIVIGLTTNATVIGLTTGATVIDLTTNATDGYRSHD